MTLLTQASTPLLITERNPDAGLMVVAPENTAEAKRQAAAAAASAAVAQAAAGPNYASITAGNTATVAGQTFAVDNGNGTISVYAHGAATTADALRTIIKDPPASTSATLIGAAHDGNAQAALDARTIVVPTLAALAARIVAAGQTFALADKSRPTDFIAKATTDLTTRETAAAALDTSHSVVMPSATAGVTILTRMDRIRPEQFSEYGDVNNRTQAALAIQKAANVAAALGLPFRGRADLYEIDRGINFPSNLIMEGDAPGWGLVNTLTTAEATAYAAAPPVGTQALYWSNATLPYCGLFIGAMHPAYMPLASGTGNGTGGSTSVNYYAWKACSAIAFGTRDVTLSTPANAAAFTKGKLVWIRSAEYFSTLGGKNEFPDLACLRRVLVAGDGSTGALKLDRPMPFAITNAYICDANGITGTTDLVNVAPYICDRPRIEGMTILCDTARGVPYFRTGAYDGQLHFEHIEGQECHSVNAMWNTKITAISSYAVDKVVEFAQASGQVSVRDGTGQYQYKSGVSSAFPFKSQEHNFGCTYEADNVQIAGPTSGGAYASPIRFSQARGCRFKYGKGTITGIWDQIAAFDTTAVNADGHDAAQTQSVTEDCSIQGRIDATGATFAILTRMSNGANRDGIESLRKPTIDLEFYGSPTVRLADLCGNNPVVRGYYSNNGPSSTTGIRFLNTGTNTTTAAEIVANGAVVIEAYAAQTQARRINLNGLEYRMASVAVSTSATTYSPDFRIPDIEITFTGASFQLTAPGGGAAAPGMRQRVTLINGTAGSITPTSAVQFPGMTLPALAAGAKCSFTLERVNNASSAARYRLVEPVSGAIV